MALLLLYTSTGLRREEVINLCGRDVRVLKIILLLVEELKVVVIERVK